MTSDERRTFITNQLSLACASTFQSAQAEALEALDADLDNEVFDVVTFVKCFERAHFAARLYPKTVLAYVAALRLMLHR